MPFEYKDCQIQEIIQQFREYIIREDRPSVVGFCVDKFMSKQTFYNWARKYPEIDDLIKICSTKQEFNLCEGGLKSEYNSVITKLILATNHGYRDRIEQQENPERPFGKKITGEMSQKEAAQAYLEMIKGEK